MNLDDKHLIGVIGSYGVLNVQRLCRIINGRDFKWCHHKHTDWQKKNNRMDSQFNNQCKLCDVHYRDIHKQVMRLIKEEKIKTKKMIFYDVKNDEQDKRLKNDRGRKRDLFRFIYLHQEDFDNIIGIQTLDYYGLEI